MKIGIIGGSGLYAMDSLEGSREEQLTTPFGRPSAPYLWGTVEARELCFLPRHGHGHALLPSEINHRANLFGFKELGITHLVSFTAVGSLREAYRPGDFVLPDQYFDRTKRSLEHTFFGRGLVAHIPFGEPTCPELRSQLAGMVSSVVPDTVKVHAGGTYVNMEGPAFSTRAESDFYRAAGFDVIGMTSLPEAKLAREAGIHYAAVAMVTDYDCWHAEEEDVSAGQVLATVQANVAHAQRIVVEVARRLSDTTACACAHALDEAIMTDPERMPEDLRRELALLLPDA